MALTGNAVQNGVAIPIMAMNQPDGAVQVVLRPPVPVAFTIAPVITLLAPMPGAPHVTHAPRPMLIATPLRSAVVVVLVVDGGESTWFEGCALAVYRAIAAAFGWG